MKNKLHVCAAIVTTLTLAARAADAPADPGLKVTLQKHPEDKVVITSDKNEATVTITSASGIGSLTLETAGKPWPAKITIVMLYAPGKPYTKLEGFDATMSPPNPEGLSYDPHPVVNGGTATITVAKDEHLDEKLGISWVDFYR